ncbi:MAG TPA: UDP-N-acetylmuramoyl-tripeptide--D-alanyl-D-alanine ligase [Candidatus Limnocylindrales bacterium]|nr:UDP-N-acetylmuramoyl-tripeptide--D-alanyl-D-alanine ligase [Candidatus Limnocylindrales bacterium]
MRVLSYFWIKAPWTLVYMLQQAEYNPWKFISWVKTVPHLSRIRQRGQLVLTGRVRLMLLISYGSWLMMLVGGIALAIASHNPVPLVLSVLAPMVCVMALFLSTILLQKFVVAPAEHKEALDAQKKLTGMHARRIAVLGSYGKTTMKELLLTVLSEGKKVAATPGNKNVLISHARWVKNTLKGDEEVLIFEYGESKPGDILELGEFSRPDIAVITGLAPAHMDGYPSLDAIADDLASIKEVVKSENLYINGNSELLRAKVSGNFYDQKGIGNFVVGDVRTDFMSTSFSLDIGGKKLHLYTGLLGAHQIGPLCAVVAIALALGLNEKQIINGVAATMPYEHRMQARNLHGAWIVDDTYNGNIEGMRAGLELLKSLPAKRKIYVTPGLVDQGAETEPVHVELGKLIAAAKPDRVVLMKNSVTEHIRNGLNEAGYTGEVTIEVNPLDYYTNLEHYLAAGDVAMLQNDWPDSYR